MNPIADVVTGVAAPLFGLIDELFTSDDERNAAKVKILQMEQDGKLKTMQTQMSAILAEAQSTDKWTSRARPGFLYVIYIFILAALPMGGLSAYDPDMAKSVAYGVGEWLKVIPESMWGLFGVGYLGYAGVRSWDKKNGKAK
jgi:hypothetical protein